MLRLAFAKFAIWHWTGMHPRHNHRRKQTKYSTWGKNYLFLVVIASSSYSAVKCLNRSELAGSPDFATPLRLLKLGSYYKIDPEKKAPLNFTLTQK